MVAIDPGFLEKIFADPADDNHRLAVCDWLTENGDPARAELIQLQCDGDQLPPV
ncbi:MAG: TIGR02996 domain-containing protein [Proteobacteria bacterium]|nr:TIGR02996 domain-containing protein [Pseudomonadota bacterium]